MKFIDLFKLATRMFKARTSRTLLTILGMSVGISAILFLVSLGYGLQKTLLEKITTAESLVTLDVTEAKSGQAELNSELVEKIKKLEEVEEVSPAFQLSAQGSLESLSTEVLLTGVKPSFLRLGGYKINKGESLNDDNPNGIIITTALTQVFGKTPEAILGKEIAFSVYDAQDANLKKNGAGKNVKKTELPNKYKIIGIIDGEDSLAYLNAASLDNLSVQHYSQLKVKCRTDAAMKNARDKIEGYGLMVSSLSTTVDQANKIFKVIQVVLMLFGVIALVVSAIGMFNTMTIALLERTEEIGIMKAIGASDSGISWMFIMEATIMGFFGGLGGVLIGYAEGKIFNGLVNLVAYHFGGQAVQLFYSPLWFILLIIIFAALVGLVTGFIPARRASKIDPLDALRYK